MTSHSARAWWRDAVIYQAYPRSFADGIGDVAGMRARLNHLRDLGVDAVWISPRYRSPMADGGYDISNHCDIDPKDTLLPPDTAVWLRTG